MSFVMRCYACIQITMAPTEKDKKSKTPTQRAPQHPQGQEQLPWVTRPYAEEHFRSHLGSSQAGLLFRLRDSLHVCLRDSLAFRSHAEGERGQGGQNLPSTQGQEARARAAKPAQHPQGQEARGPTRAEKPPQHPQGQEARGPARAAKPSQHPQGQEASAGGRRPGPTRSCRSSRSSSAK